MMQNISTPYDVIITSLRDSQDGTVNVTNVTLEPVDSSEPGNQAALALTRLIVQRILVPVITTIGLFGNIISICVLTRKCMISSTNCYLTTLAVFDLMYLVFSFTLSLKHYKTFKQLDAFMYVYPYSRVLTDICSNVSVCLTVTFSLERLVAVCYPMKGRTICTPERARILTIIITVCAAVCTAPEFFEWKTVRISTKENITKVVIRNSDLADTVSYQVGYNYFLIFTFTILPLILLSTFNGILIKSVLAATRIRRQLTYNSIARGKDSGKRNNEQTRITLMLVSVVVVFLLCQFPNAAVLLYSCYIELENIDLSREEVNNLIISANIVNLLVLINASVNFILYSAMSTKFRRVFLQMFCSSIYKQQDIYSRTEMTSYTKTQTSPLRYRSKRVSSMSGNGTSRQITTKCDYTTCPSEAPRQTHLTPDKRYDGAHQSNSASETKTNAESAKQLPVSPEVVSPILRVPTNVAVSRRRSSKDGSHRVHGIDNEVAMWENEAPPVNTWSDQASLTVCVPSNEQGGREESGNSARVQSRMTCVRFCENRSADDTLHLT